MITADKVYILLQPGHTEAKHILYTERLKAIPMAEGATVDFRTLDTVGSARDILTRHGLNSLLAPDTAHEAARAVAHWTIWHQAFEQRSDTILILEEGFLPEGTHYHVLPDEGWDMLYLGRDTEGGDFPSPHTGMVFPGYSDGAFACMLTANALQKLVASGFDHNVMPVGEFLSAMHGMHPDNTVRDAIAGRLATLAPMKSFITKDTFQPWQAGYTPLHRSLYILGTPEGLPWINKYINAQILQREYDLICDEPIDNVYAFPLFTPLFCQHIIEEAEHHGQWTSYRGDARPATDIRLTNIGLQETYSALLQKYLYPLLAHKYQLHGDGWKKLISQNFVVRYQAEEQGHLGLHNDGSYLSMVVALNTDFSEGGTYFPKFKKLIRHEQAGYASVHPGLVGYVHGARPITRGKRYILASFFFSPNHHPLMEDLY